MKYHNRHDYMAKTGKRISKGAWERLNRAYAVHEATDSRGRPKHQIVGYKKDWRGNYKRDKEGNRIPLVKRCTTLVLLNGTVKHSRKVFLRRDAHQPNNRRDRYRSGTEVAVCR